MKRIDLLESFLKKEDIYHVEKMEIKNDFNLENCSEAMSDFHLRIKEKKNYTMGMVSLAGKEITQQKILFNRLLAFSKEFNINIDELINFASEKKRLVNNNDINKILLRGYEKSEIVIEKIYLNMKKENNLIFINDISRVKFGIVEDDFINFIRKIRRHNKDINLGNYIDNFLEREGLDENSKRYIESVLDFPKEESSYISECYLKGIKDLDEVSKTIKSFNFK